MIEKIDLMAAFTSRDLINELFRQNIALQAHVQALQGVLAVVMAQVYHKSDDECAKLITDKADEFSKKISRANEFLIKARNAQKR